MSYFWTHPDIRLMLVADVRDIGEIKVLNLVERTTVDSFLHGVNCLPKAKEERQKYRHLHAGFFLKLNLRFERLYFVP